MLVGDAGVVLTHPAEGVSCEWVAGLDAATGHVSEENLAMRNWIGRAMDVSVADGVVGSEIGAAPVAENVFASLVGDVVRELQDDAALHGGAARLEDLDGAGKRRFGIRFFPGCSGSWVWCQGRWIVSEISGNYSRLS